MPTRKKKVQATRPIGARSAMIVLIAALMLSGLNLVLMIGEAGELNGLTGSWEMLQSNYVTRSPAKEAGKAEAAEKAQAVPPEVVWSVVKYRDGEQQALWTALVQPLLANYAAGGSLKVVLIERKSPASTDVNVRLFFADGSETSYLWPSTHAAADGTWAP